MTSSFPLVSVVVPTYQRAAFLGETLDSVRSQTVATDLEIIVVEDGSREAPDALTKHAGKFEYVWQPNQGVGVARNAGAARARGAWVAFLDDDDLWSPEKLERQLALAARHPETGLVHTDHLALVDGTLQVPRRTPPRGSVPTGWVSSALMLSNFVVTSSTMVRKSDFDRVGGFTSNREWAEDLDLWLRLSRVCQFGFVEEPLTIYRDHAQSLSSALRWHVCRANVLEHFVRSFPAIRDEVGPATLRRRMRDVYWTGAYAHFAGGEHGIAARLFAAAWRWQPSDPRPLAYAAGCLTGRRGVAALQRLKGALR